MKRFILLFFLLIFGFGSAQDIEASSENQNNYEHILSFHSDIDISKDAEVTITEKIKVYADGNEIRRGIMRSLPLWRNINGKKIRIRYDIISVLRDGEKDGYHTENGSSDMIIYFGKKDVLLEPGVYQYELKYQTKDQISFFETYDEFFWNVNGNLGIFKVDEVSARVTLPDNAEILQQSCYTGTYGTNESNCVSKQVNSHAISWSANNLAENEGLSVAVGFKKGIFTPPPPPTMLEKYGVLIALFLSALGLCFYFYNSWQKYGIDPQKPVAYPQFNSPQDLSPAAIGYLEKEYYAGEMITAAIINLAIKGFIKIIEDDKRILGIFGGKEYTLEKLKEPDQTLPKEEINLMNKFFSGKSNTIAFDGKYNSKIEYAVSDFTASLKFQYDEFLKKGNNTSKIILPLLSIIILYGLGLYLSYNLTFSEVHLAAGLIVGGISLFVGIVFAVSFERYKLMRIFFGFVAVGMVVVMGTIITADTSRSENIGFYASYAFLTFGFIGMVLFQYLIKQPTPEKLETKSLIEGYKMYLGTAEEKTLQFHNPPQMTPEVFEKMLPFAMVLGVDKIWGEKFQNMLKNSAMQNQSYQSNWFVGASIMNMNFANTLNSSLSQSIASSSTQPSSSGSGSGGGGFSGGGGGGGGVGGW